MDFRVAKDTLSFFHWIGLQKLIHYPLCPFEIKKISDF